MLVQVGGSKRQRSFAYEEYLAYYEKIRRNRTDKIEQLRGCFKSSNI